MRTQSFDLILKEMYQWQRDSLVALERDHSDLKWRGGNIESKTLRVSMFSGGRSIAAINTRKKKAFLRLEFRSRDYDGEHASPTGHRNFNRRFNLTEPHHVRTASYIISQIKKNHPETHGKNRMNEPNAEHSRLWEQGTVQSESKIAYRGFGNAPNDDPEELQQFAARVRRGQPAFRKNLLTAYGRKCVITGHGPAEVLEAVHIAPHAKFGINELDNGLLMRGDLHSLFDANLLRINPDELTVEIDDTLSETPYWKLNGKTILPRVDGNQISTKYLKERWDSQKDA